MVQIQAFFAEIGALFVNLFDRPDWRNIVDIGILAVLIYSVIKLVMHTRANSLFKGILFILVLSWLANALEISAVSWLLQQVINTGVLVLVIVFQPELRRALDQIGRSKWTRQMFSSQKKQSSGRTEQHVAEIVRALNNMSRKKIGALIVFERSTGLGDVIESGTVVDAEISDPLIENIFEPNTPLHDGAMVIRDERIVAAACILQLSEDYTISRELGTRHPRGHRHHRGDRRRFPDRLGGNRHHLHGARRASSRAIWTSSPSRSCSPSCSAPARARPPRGSAPCPSG